MRKIGQIVMQVHTDTPTNTEFLLHSLVNFQAPFTANPSVNTQPATARARIKLCMRALYSTLYRECECARVFWVFSRKILVVKLRTCAHALLTFRASTARVYRAALCGFRIGSKSEMEFLEPRVLKAMFNERACGLWVFGIHICGVVSRHTRAGWLALTHA